MSRADSRFAFSATVDGANKSLLLTEDMQVALLSFGSTDPVPTDIDRILGLARADIPAEPDTTYLSFEATGCPRTSMVELLAATIGADSQ